MPGVIATLPKFQFSANGAPLVGGTLTVCIAGTTTPTTTWQDAALSIANTNPVTLDARGECVLWLDPAIVYKFILKNAQGVIQWTQDHLSNSAALAIALRAELALPTGAASIGGAVQTVNSIVALRGLLKTSASKNAFVAGYYAPGDGGGGRLLPGRGRPHQRRRRVRLHRRGRWRALETGRCGRAHGAPGGRQGQQRV